MLIVATKNLLLAEESLTVTEPLIAPTNPASSAGDKSQVSSPISTNLDVPIAFWKAYQS